jgi:SAM-dependent methyltransferase
MAEPPGLLCVQADLKASLPLADGAFDRVLCHNVLEVLPDPDALAAEAIRVLRPGGRLVLAHSDFDTLIFASEDLEPTRRLVRDYCDTQQPWMDAVDGTIGRRLADIAGRAGLVVEDVQAAVVLGRRFLPGEIGWGYARNLADTLRGDGRADPAEPDRWLAGLQRLDDRGAFLFSVNDYAVICGRMPR